MSVQLCCIAIQIGRQDTSYLQDSSWPSTQRPLPFKPTPVLDASPNQPQEAVPGTRHHLGPHSLIHTGERSEPGSRPHTQRGSSQEVQGGMRIQPWGCLLSGDISFSSSGFAVPSKGTSTHLDPEQGPQAMLCEPVSSLRCPDGPSACTAPGTPFLDSRTFSSLVCFTSLSRTPLHPPHTKQKSSSG